MRNHLSRTARAALAALGAGGYWLACLGCTVNSVTNNGTGADGGTDTTDAAATDAGVDAATDTDGGTDTTDAGADAAAPQAYVRLAHFSPDTGVLDVCFTPQGSTYAGQTPQLAGLVTPGDAGTPVDDAGAPLGLAYTQVTSYLIIPPGTYGVRVVAAGSLDCDTPVAELASVTVAQNAYATLAAVGESHVVQTDQALKLVSFADDVTAAAGTAGLRFINASPSLASVDFGTGTNASSNFAPLVTGVAFGQAGSSADSGAVDANGYLASQPLAGATLSAHVTNANADTVTATGVTVGAASAATFALVGGVTGGGAAVFLQCPDADDSASASLFTACSVISPH